MTSHHDVAVLVDYETASRLLKYDADTGLLYWRVGHGKARRGAAAGWIRSDGYVELKLNGRQYRAHRLAWLLTYREFPNGEVDHINNNRSDNRIENLRDATRAENNWNTPVRSTNTSGVKGVSFHKASGKWSATLCNGDKQVHVGIFETLEHATIAIRVARRIIHGGFARHE